MFGINLPNPIDLAEKALGTVTDFAGDAVKGGTNLATTLVNTPIGLVTSIFKPADKISDLIDIIKNPKLPFLPGLPTLPSIPSGDSSYQGMLDSITGLGGEIEDLKKQLENPDLTPDQRMELSFKMQEKMQERLQMITMLTNLLKSEHDSIMAIAQNFRT